MHDYDPFEEVNPRSGNAVVATLLVAPMTFLLGAGLVHFIGQIRHPDPPEFPWQAPPTPSTSWGLLLALGVPLLFLAYALFVLVTGLLTGKALRLVPWWLAWIVMAFFTVVAASSIGMAVWDGNTKTMLQLFKIVPFLAIGWPAVIWLRRSQSGHLRNRPPPPTIVP
jgi:hypothetical protein